MRLKGIYSGETSYSVGDVVKYTDNVIYHLQHPATAGTPPHDTRYWGRVDQELANAILMVIDAMEIEAGYHIDIVDGLSSTDKAKALSAKQGKALKTLIDATDGELSTLNPDAKTLVLASSTASSTKQFAITVDDDGELTATEITSGGET